MLEAQNNLNAISDETLFPLTRRGVLLSGAAAVASIGLPATFTTAAHAASRSTTGETDMATVTTKDGVEIFYKDWGPKDAQPIMFHHGWPLSSDDWDAQMLFFLSKGYRVVAHDRRGHGRSAQVSTACSPSAGGW